MALCVRSEPDATMSIVWHRRRARLAGLFLLSENPSPDDSFTLQISSTYGSRSAHVKPYSLCGEELFVAGHVRPPECFVHFGTFEFANSGNWITAWGGKTAPHRALGSNMCDCSTSPYRLQ